MAKKKVEKLDLSGVGGRARCVLKKLGVETAGELLAVREEELLALKYCGDKTAAEIVMLQMKYGKKTVTKSSRAGELMENLLKLHEVQGAVLRRLKKSLGK